MATACFCGFFSSRINFMFFDIVFFDLPWNNGMAKPHTGKFVSCLSCYKQFYIPVNRFETAKYCSRKCKDKENTIRIIKNCLICGKEFEHISARCNTAKYCSRLCYHRSQKGRGAKEFKCATCDIKFMSSPSKRYKFCTPKCRGLFHRASEEYADFKSLRKAWVLRGYIQYCEICKYDAVKEILGIHHRDGNRKNNKKDNLLIVCPNCHSLIHRKHIPHVGRDGFT